MQVSFSHTKYFGYSYSNSVVTWAFSKSSFIIIVFVFPLITYHQSFYVLDESVKCYHLKLKTMKAPIIRNHGITECCAEALNTILTDLPNDYGTASNTSLASSSTAARTTRPRETVESTLTITLLSSSFD